jgi:hypothetical protein
MNKLTYEEWKDKYCAKITQEQLEQLKNTHGVENPKELIENYNLEAYQKYKQNEWNYTKPIIGLDENGQPITIDSWGKK